MAKTPTDKKGEAQTRDLHKKLMAKMAIGDSFFVKGIRPEDLRYIRSLGYTLSFKLSIRHVTYDQIYGTSGSRVVRVE